MDLSEGRPYGPSVQVKSDVQIDDRPLSTLGVYFNVLFTICKVPSLQSSQEESRWTCGKCICFSYFRSDSL